MKNYTFALLVDGENASPNDFAGVIREVEKNGDVALKRVYADWTQPNQSGWKDILHETGARPVHQFNYGKDAADHALIMDAIELTISNPRMDAICIVSSDGGYHTLAQRIREKGLYVMGIGKRHTPERLRRACHHFVYTDLLDADEKEEAPRDNLSLDSLLVKAYQDAAVDDEPVYLGLLGHQLKKIDPAFDPRSYSYPSLKALIKEASHLFETVSETQDRFFIKLKEGVVADKPEHVREGLISRWITTYGFIEVEGKNYYFTKLNVNAAQRDHRFRKGDRVRFTVVKEPGSTAEHSADQNGKAKNVEVLMGMPLSGQKKAV